jgi:hypothetical protein
VDQWYGHAAAPASPVASGALEQVQGIITVGEFYAMAAGGQIIFT